LYKKKSLRFLSPECSKISEHFQQFLEVREVIECPEGQGAAALSTKSSLGLK
jgi:hypothetical protein